MDPVTERTQMVITVIQCGSHSRRIIIAGYLLMQQYEPPSMIGLRYESGISCGFNNGIPKPLVPENHHQTWLHHQLLTRIIHVNYLYICICLYIYIHTY